MKCRFLYILLLTAFPTVCFSQTESNDSISIELLKTDSIGPESRMLPDSISSITKLKKYSLAHTDVSSSLYSDRLVYTIDLHIPAFHFSPGRVSLFYWRSGEVVATGGSRLFPGLMKIDSGTFGVSQSVGNFSFYAGGMANKYGFFRGVHTQYGLNGNISYRFTPRLSATVFGDYYFSRPPRMANGMPMSPSMIGYYGRSNFGGYIDYEINEHWGVQTGVQTVQQVGTNRYKAEPIATPYYKVNKKVAIGLPVGQILYHILKK